MIETWRSIENHPGYEVSDLGRVRSLDRVIADGRGGKRRMRGRVLKLKEEKKTGYLEVSLSGRQKRRVHILVLEAFTGPRPQGLIACHNNDEKLDCAASNLRWDTYSANGRDLVENKKHWQAQKSRCPQGHKYTPENTRIVKNRRHCRECDRIYNQTRKLSRAA